MFRKLEGHMCIPQRLGSILRLLTRSLSTQYLRIIWYGIFTGYHESRHCQWDRTAATQKYGNPVSSSPRLLPPYLYSKEPYREQRLDFSDCRRNHRKPRADQPPWNIITLLDV